MTLSSIPTPTPNEKLCPHVKNRRKWVKNAEIVETEAYQAGELKDRLENSPRH